MLGTFTTGWCLHLAPAAARWSAPLTCFHVALPNRAAATQGEAPAFLYDPKVANALIAEGTHTRMNGRCWGGRG